MKILWAKSDFLHPTTKGGHIRTLETLKRLHQRHEIHYVALDLAEQPGGVERSSEYCTKAYPIPHSAPARGSVKFWMQASAGLFSRLPLSVSRYRSAAMARQIEALMRSEKFDSLVCDFLFPAPNIGDLSRWTLFQHNVEAMIWKRHSENAGDPVRRAYFEGQYRRMLAYEAEVCRSVRNIIAVSDSDAETMRSLYGVSRLAAVPTGVDVDYFRSRGGHPYLADMVFVGSMDWMPNIDAVLWFAAEILPLIRASHPEARLAVVGRRPAPEIARLTEKDAHIQVTGTVDDIRPYLWGSSVAIIPLRIGGGTRLKIYEAMAAGIPVVSTTIGAEGLDYQAGIDLCVGDTPTDFASQCLAQLDDADARRRIANAAFEKVSSRYSWEGVSQKFEELLV